MEKKLLLGVLVLVLLLASWGQPARYENYMGQISVPAGGKKTALFAS